MAHVKEMTSLTSLDLSHCNVTGVGVGHLKSLPRLVSLTMFSCTALDPVINQLVCFPALVRLNLAILSLDAPHTDASVQRLTVGLCRLEHLGLWPCGALTDAGLGHFAALPMLSTLRIGAAKRITAVGLERLRKLPCLTELSVDGMGQITAAGWGYLKDMPQLKSLDLTHCGLTDADLAHVSMLHQIETFVVLQDSTLLTDAALEHFRGLHQLRHLRLWHESGESYFTEGALTRLRIALPSLRIDA